MKPVLAALWILSASLCTCVADQEFAVLRTAKDSYTNVVVTRQTDTHLFIMHDGGMATVKLSDLDGKTKSLLGYKDNSKPAGAQPPGALIIEKSGSAVAATSAPKKSKGLPMLFYAGIGVIGGGVGYWFRQRHRPQSVRLVNTTSLLKTSAPARSQGSTQTRIRTRDTAPASGGRDAHGRQTMSEEAERYLEEKHNSQWPFRAARYSTFLPVLILVSAYAARASHGVESKITFGVVTLILIGTGLYLGIFALWNIRRLGTRNLLIQGLAGTVMNAILISFVIGNISSFNKEVQRARWERAQSSGGVWWKP